MTNLTLFELPSPQPKPKREAAVCAAPAPRVQKAERRQVRLLPMSLDALLPDDHQARAVWAYVDQLDLDGFYEPIGSVEGRAGRPSTDPLRLLKTQPSYAVDLRDDRRGRERASARTALP